jgi:hypothetical protein
MSTLTADEQDELLALTREADSVELKLSVAEDDHGKASRALGLDPIEAEIRQVYFFDTPDLALDAVGVVVRARRIQGGTADTVVKLRPVVPEELPKDIRHSASMKVEVDLMPGKFVASASMKGKSDPEDVQKAADGKLELSELFSKEQHEFFKLYAPGTVKLNDLVPLGPILTLKLKFPEKELGRDLVAETWFYPDNSRILELSTKCEPDETFQVTAEARSFLVEKGVDLDSEQKTKTRMALQYFSEHPG